MNPFAIQTITALVEVITGGSGSRKSSVGVYRTGNELELYLGSFNVDLQVGSRSRVPAVREAIKRQNRLDPAVLVRVIEAAVDLRDFLDEPEKQAAVVEYMNRRLRFDGVELRIVGDRYQLVSNASTKVVGTSVKTKADEAASSDPVYNVEGAAWHDPATPNLTPIKHADLAHDAKAELLLMTATSIELHQVLRLLRPRANRQHLLKVTKGPETYYVGRFGAFDAVLTRCEMGSDGPMGASHTARSAIEAWSPTALVMIGIAFGADRKRYKPADILIAEQIIPYEGQRIGERKIFRDPIPLTGITLLNRFKNALGWRFQRPDGTAVQVHSGRVLSGEKLIDNPTFKKELLEEFPEAIGGEMEGAGVFAAAARAKIEWILVKAVCDWADGKKHGEYQEMAAAAAASVAEFVMRDENALVVHSA